MKEFIKDISYGAFGGILAFFLILVGTYAASGPDPVPMINKPAYGGVCGRHYTTSKFDRECLDCTLYVARDTVVFLLKLASPKQE